MRQVSERGVERGGVPVLGWQTPVAAMTMLDGVIFSGLAFAPGTGQAFKLGVCRRFLLSDSVCVL